MVRTMAGGQRKAVAAKAPRKSVGCSSSSSSSAAVSSVFSPGRAGKAKSRASGGNAATQWDAPKWQKGITCFFKKEVETKITKLGEDSDSVTEEGEAVCSQSSTHTIDLNEAPITATVLSIFDAEESGPSSSGSVCSAGSDDGEQPGPSSRM
ncbi:PCNA-associated factor-like [Bolinopsis microptera]|uniref:PCNA-associated factor-like n=1 Tax=Bolinopsis microptera TaxID=2820187 RepID=UPI00307953FF